MAVARYRPAAPMDDSPALTRHLPLIGSRLLPSHPTPPRSQPPSRLPERQLRQIKATWRRPDKADRIVPRSPAVAAIHARAGPGREIWSLAGLALATIYATLVSIVYIVQLGVVIPQEWRGTAEAVGLLKCCGQGVFNDTAAPEIYTMMSLATLL